MNAFRSLLFNLLFFAGTAVIGLGGLPTLLLSREWGHAVARFWAWWMAKSLAWTVRLTYEVRGLEHLPPAPAVIACKHQSSWDTIIFLHLFPNASYVLKRELTWIPVFGWYLSRIYCVVVDRKAGASAIKNLVRQARLTAAQKHYIVIFPEGTRSAPGAKLPYQPGAVALYDMMKLTVVPAALNSGLFWGRRRFVKRPGKIVLEFLEPIPPGLDRKTFAAQLEERIESATEALLAEAEGTAEIPETRQFPCPSRSETEQEH
jgi:1-acyl-sn-glycerol-3-phosphate acyltransferase